MTRDEAVAYLAARHGEIYRKAGRLADESDVGFLPVINDVWNHLGLGTATDTGTLPYDQVTKLLKAYSLDLILAWLVTKFSYSTEAPNTRVDAYQVFQGTLELSKTAFADAAQYGFGPRTVSYGEINVSDRVGRNTGFVQASANYRRGRRLGINRASEF